MTNQCRADFTDATSGGEYVGIARGQKNLRPAMYCVKCDDPVRPFRCCEVWQTCTCRTCHDELSHGVIRDQNVHLCGNHRAALNGVDRDIDAYLPASFSA